METGSRTTNHIVFLGSETLRSARCPTEWTHGYGCNSGVSLFDSGRYLNSPPQIVASAIQTHITHRETERRRECVYEVNLFFVLVAPLVLPSHIPFLFCWLVVYHSTPFQRFAISSFLLHCGLLQLVPWVISQDNQSDFLLTFILCVATSCQRGPAFLLHVCFHGMCGDSEYNSGNCDRADGGL